MENIEISAQVLYEAKRNFLNYGGEGYIYKPDSTSIYKIFKTDEKDVLENKLAKIIKLNQLGIDFLTNPAATLSCNHKFVGYKMNYDEDDMNWFNTFMTLDEKIKYLKTLKDDLLVLEQHGILYADIKDDNFLINRKTGMLKFCDIDNVQIDGLKVDQSQYISRCIQDNNLLFDNSIHAFMHNLYTLEQLVGLDIYTHDDLTDLVNNKYFEIFNDNQEQILENMVLLKKRKISGRYLIDNLR